MMDEWMRARRAIQGIFIFASSLLQYRPDDLDFYNGSLTYFPLSVGVENTAGLFDVRPSAVSQCRAGLLKEMSHHILRIQLISTLPGVSPADVEVPLRSRHLPVDRLSCEPLNPS